MYAHVFAEEHRKSLSACEGGVVIKRLTTLMGYPSDKVYCTYKVVVFGIDLNHKFILSASHVL